LQPCVSFNHKNTFEWYRRRVYKVEDEKGYDPGNQKAALEKALEWGDKIPIGTIYEADLPIYEDHLPALSKTPLVKQKINGRRVKRLLAEFM
jgi:2-oxoglutarate ferredoxin oxidoreductase subunit beta